MEPSARLRCRCGQSFTAWLINGAPRLRCPFCKAPVEGNTEVVESSQGRPLGDRSAGDRSAGGSPFASPSGNSSPLPVNLSPVSPNSSPIPASPSPLPASASPHPLAGRPAPQRPSVARLPIRPNPWLWALTCGLPTAALGAAAGWLLNLEAWGLVGLAVALPTAAAAFLAARFLPWAARCIEGAAPCPGCAGQRIFRVKLTLWGGFLGTRLANHVQCADCGRQYNGKTGEENTYAMISVAASRVALLLIVLTILLYFAFRSARTP